MAYDDDYGWKPYVPVAARRAQAAREVAKLATKGRQVDPLIRQLTLYRDLIDRKTGDSL